MRGLGLLTIVVATFASAPVFAAQRPSNSGSEAYYRCKDANGQQLYGDSMPSGCLGQDTEVLNAHGMVLRVIEGEQTRARRQAREAAEAREKQLRQEREQRDRMLLETYTNVEDIERLRDQRIELLLAQRRVTEQAMSNMRERQARLESQVARFKPYSSNPNAPPVPDHLAEEMVNTVNSLHVYQESLEKNQREQDEVRATFTADIQRFKELKGIK
jgi:hypothetical protein